MWGRKYGCRQRPELYYYLDWHKECLSLVWVTTNPGGLKLAHQSDSGECINWNGWWVLWNNGLETLGVDRHSHMTQSLTCGIVWAGYLDAAAQNRIKDACHQLAPQDRRNWHLGLHRQLKPKAQGSPELWTHLWEWKSFQISKSAPFWWPNLVRSFGGGKIILPCESALLSWELGSVMDPRIIPWIWVLEFLRASGQPCIGGKESTPNGRNENQSSYRWN